MKVAGNEVRTAVSEDLVLLGYVSRLRAYDLAKDHISSIFKEQGVFVDSLP
jgi:hypothetical protein